MNFPFLTKCNPHPTHSINYSVAAPCGIFSFFFSSFLTFLGKSFFFFFLLEIRKLYSEGRVRVSIGRVEDEHSIADHSRSS